MSFPCPHCGGEIVPVPGSAPFPGWRNPPQNPPQTAATQPQTAEVAGMVLDLDRSNPSPRIRSTSKNKHQYSPAFLEFWKVYPRHREKRTAFTCWARAIQRLTATATATDAATANAILVAGALRYRNDPNRLDEFTKYAEGWLNGDGWEDEPLPARMDRRRPPDPPRPLTDGEAYQAIERALRDE